MSVCTILSRYGIVVSVVEPDPTVAFRLSGTVTGMHYVSGSINGFGSGSKIK
jgi:hypothetical protein